MLSAPLKLLHDVCYRYGPEYAEQLRKTQTMSKQAPIGITFDNGPPRTSRAYRFLQSRSGPHGPQSSRSPMPAAAYSSQHHPGHPADVAYAFHPGHPPFPPTADRTTGSPPNAYAAHTPAAAYAPRPPPVDHAPSGWIEGGGNFMPSPIAPPSANAAVVSTWVSTDGDEAQVKGLDFVIGCAPDIVMQAAVDWCYANQVVDFGMLFEDPYEVDALLGQFLSALPLHNGGVYAQMLHKRLGEMRAHYYV